MPPFYSTDSWNTSILFWNYWTYILHEMPPFYFIIWHTSIFSTYTWNASILCQQILYVTYLYFIQADIHETPPFHSTDSTRNTSILFNRYTKYFYPYSSARYWSWAHWPTYYRPFMGTAGIGWRPGYGYYFSPIPTMISTPTNTHMILPLRPWYTEIPSTGLYSKGRIYELMNIV